MKVFVIPMDAPSTKQIEKSFRKVKKMQYPELPVLDFRELSYLGWNDSGTNRKYLVRKIDSRFTGVYGSFSTDVQKGHCAICNQISTVAFSWQQPNHLEMAPIQKKEITFAPTAINAIVS